MSTEETFVFKITQPRWMPSADNQSQVFEIHAKYPHLAYHLPFKARDGVPSKDKIALAVAELKVRLIQEIANATFILEKAE